MATAGFLDKSNYQGGKQYGQKMKQKEVELDDINKTFAEDEDWSEVEDLPEKLESYKKQFIEYDEDKSGDLGMMDLKLMMEKLGKAKTHLELKKMISEVDTTNSGTITYPEFLTMMLGKKSSVLKLILLFEEKMKEKAKPQGVAPKRDLSSLP